MKWRVQNQSGDTIVEVLIAIAIVAVVLVGAFAVTSSSNKTVLDNNEHTQAQQLLQSKVEAFRSYRASHTTTITNVQYCIGDDGQPLLFTSLDCQNQHNVVGGVDNAQIYFMKNADVTYGTSDDFVFTVKWDSVKGNTAQEQLVYRAYAES